MAKIDVTLKVQVQDGPIINDSTSLDIEASGKIDVLLPPGTVNTPLVVEVQPSAAAGQVKLVMVKSSLYSDSANDQKITYSVDGLDKEIELDQPHLYLGSGAVSTLGDAPPKLLKFKNTYPTTLPANEEAGTPEEDVSEKYTAQITILVGRDATPDS